MGRVLLVARLGARDLRHRPVQVVLVLLVITTAMATLTLGLILHGVTRKPYDQTKAATAGPDVVASSVDVTGAAALARFAALAHAPGVTARSGPYPVAWPVLRAHGTTAYVMAEGRSAAPAVVDQPEVTSGSWVQPGEVVLERALAQTLGVRVGQVVALDGQPFRVAGIAVTAAVPVYSQVCFYGGCSGPGGRPRSFDTGLVWVMQATARGLSAPGNPVTYYLNLRLANPAAAPAFVRTHQPPPSTGPAALTAWQSLREAAATLVVQEQQVLVPASWLLGLLAIASVAVVASTRMADQDQRVGLLKAVGGTPRLAAAVLLAEHLLVALAGAALGLGVGWLAAPLLTSPGASLVGSPGAPQLGWLTVLIVAAAALMVAAASTLGPALRAARMSTVSVLAAAVRPPRRVAWLVRLSGWLPTPLLLGVRLIARRPRRALFSTAGFLVTGTAIVAVLVFHATVSSRTGPGFANQPGPSDPGHVRVGDVLLVLTVVLVVLAAVNAIVTTWATVLDGRRFWAIARSLGATARQTVVGLSAAQLVPALVGTLLGIPAGEALYGLVQHGGRQAMPRAWWLIALVAAVLAGATGLTAIPARAGARRPVADVLTLER
jgi:ABC-type lipoprotein release transport system permease subunit